MFNDAYEFLTSDAGKQCCSYLWNALMLLTGGTGLAVSQWFLTVVFGKHKQEVKRLIEAIREGDVTPHEITRYDIQRQIGVKDTVLRVVGTKLCIDDSVKVPWGGEISGVVTFDGVDQSNVYTRDELKRILAAAKWRRKQLVVRDREAQRKLLADHIPNPKMPQSDKPTLKA